MRLISDFVGCFWLGLDYCLECWYSTSKLFFCEVRSLGVGMRDCSLDESFRGTCLMCIVWNLLKGRVCICWRPSLWIDCFSCLLGLYLIWIVWSMWQPAKLMFWGWSKIYLETLVNSPGLFLFRCGFKVSSLPCSILGRDSIEGTTVIVGDYPNYDGR